MKLVDVARLLLRISGFLALAFAINDFSFFRGAVPGFWSKYSIDTYSHIALNLLVAVLLIGASDWVISVLLNRDRAEPLAELKPVELGVVVARMGAFWLLVNAIAWARLLLPLISLNPYDLQRWPVLLAMVRPLFFLAAAAVLYIKPGRIMWIMAPPPAERRDVPVGISK